MSFQNANQQIQRNLYNRVKTDTRYKIIDALTSARSQNNSIMESDFGFSPGKLRSFKMNYYPVVCDGEGSCNDNVCDAGTSLAPKQQIYDLTQCTASKVWQLAVNDIREVDGDLTFSQHALAQISSVLGGVRKALAMDMAAILAANVGCMPDGQPTKALSMTDPATGAIRPLGLWEIEQTFEDSGMASPYIVGDRDVFVWKKATAIGGLNNSGQDTGRFNNDRMYYDPLVASAFGDPTTGHVIAFDPQMLKLITFSRNAGMFATDWKSLEDMDRQFKESKNGKIKGTFLDPVTGLLWDLDIKFIDCDEEHWTFQLRLVWDIFFLPDYVCNIDCVNGIYHFTTCLPAAVECPEVTPPAPVTPTLYEWTPGDILPLYVADLTLGNSTTEPKATAATLAELAALLTANVDGYVFSVSGSDIQYTGYSELTGSANGGTLEIEFAAATT